MSLLGVHVYKHDSEHLSFTDYLKVNIVKFVVKFNAIAKISQICWWPGILTLVILECITFRHKGDR